MENKVVHYEVWYCPLHKVAGTIGPHHNETCITIEVGWLEAVTEVEDLESNQLGE